jgi:hypothetical protein
MSELEDMMKRFAEARPQPDPDSALRQEYANVRGNYLLETFRDGNRDAPPPPYEKWLEERNAPAKAKAALDAEASAARQEAAEATAAAAASRAEFARLQKEIKTAESRAKAATIQKLAEQRARGQGRAPMPDDRSWAARRLAKFESVKKEIGE